MSKFKIGDRVRLTDDCEMEEYGLSAGDEGIVLENSSVHQVGQANKAQYDWAATEDELELVTPALTITTGKIYRTASGAATGRVSKGDTGFEAVVDGRVRIFDEAGGAVHGGDDIVEEWVPRVGERVRFVRDNTDSGAHYGAKGEVVTVMSEASDVANCQVNVSSSHLTWHPGAYISDLEPLPVAALKIEAGKFYRTRDGRKVGPMKVWRHVVWHSDESAAPLNGGLWLDDGEPKHRVATDSPQIIAEWVDDPVAVAPPAPVSAQVDALAEEYGPVVREPMWWTDLSAEAYNDNLPSTTFTITLDTGNFHEELDEIIAKLKKIKKLQRAVGLAA